jgi:DNA replication factor GINS
MNVEELRTVKRTERQKDSLQHLRDSFYRDVADYLADRKAERERVAAEADDPFSSPEVGRLTDEIETAEDVVESIYDRRVGKIVKRATFAAAGMATEDEGLTREERELFDDLVARIETNREAVLEGVVADATGTETPASDGDATTEDATTEDGTESPDPASPTDAAAAPDPDDLLAEAMGGDRDAGVTATDGAGASRTDEPADPTPASASGDGTPTDEARSDAPADGTPADDLPRTTLRITRDVGSILGVDEREYDLASEDVVTLPTPNAEPLLDRDAAERLD